MIDRHWFDALSRVMTRGGTRRGLLGAAGIAVAELTSNDALTVTARKQKKKQKQKQKNKKKAKNRQDPPSQPTPTPTPLPQPTPTPQPPGTTPDLEVCLGAIPPDFTRESWEEYCRREHAKCPGDLCTFIYDHSTTNQAQVQCCPAPKTCCDNGCFDTDSDPNACGGCNAPCPSGNVCVAGKCKPTPCINDSSCPQGQNCLTNDRQYFCNSTTHTDCQCGCPGDYKYCQHRYGYFVCTGDCSNVT